MEQRLAALKTEKLEEFNDYCRTNPARLYLPNDDETYLDAFFEKMQNAGNKHLGSSPWSSGVDTLPIGEETRSASSMVIASS